MTANAHTVHRPTDHTHAVDPMQGTLNGMARKRQLDRLPTELLLHLSENGWTYDSQSLGWSKRGHGITNESLVDLAKYPELIRWWKRAISQGITGWKFKMEMPDEEGIIMALLWEWPDAITRLGEVAP